MHLQMPLKKKSPCSVLDEESASSGAFEICLDIVNAFTKLHCFMNRMLLAVYGAVWNHICRADMKLCFACAGEEAGRAGSAAA